MLRAQADRNLLEIKELAAYLDSFHDDAEFAQLVGGLRADNKFHAVFYELAMAVRWKSVGAIVRLAPMLRSRKVADLAAEIEGLVFIVEASIFPADDFNSEPFRFFCFDC